MDSVILPFSPDPYNSSSAAGESNFHLEDLLDFPNDDEEELDGVLVAAGTANEIDREQQQERDDDEEEVSSQATEDSTLTQAQAVSSLGFSVKSQEALGNKACSQEACSSGLCVPPDELAYQLEWLSAFNEDSSYSGDTNLASLVSSGSLRVPLDETNSRRQGANGGGSVTDSSHGEGNNKFQSSSPVSVLEERSILYANSYCTHVPSRARSKRSRNGGRVWSFDSLMPVLLDNNRQTCFMEESELSPPLSHHRAAQEKKGCALPQHHQAKRAKYERLNHKNATEVLAPRRCSHCLVQKTPQWRAGPMGPKTLCNACGVRFKSGRLLPEYRPAGSPTFVSEVHSNSHKRVLEMRRLKELEEESETSKGDDNSYNEMDHHNVAETSEASGGRDDNLGLEGPYEDKPCSGNPRIVPPMEPNELSEQRVNAPSKENSRYSIGSQNQGGGGGGREAISGLRRGEN